MSTLVYLLYCCCCRPEAGDGKLQMHDVKPVLHLPHNTKHLTLNSSNLPQKPITSAITQLPQFCHTGRSPAKPGRNPAETRQEPGSCVMADVIPVLDHITGLLASRPIYRPTRATAPIRFQRFLMYFWSAMHAVLNWNVFHIIIGGFLNSKQNINVLKRRKGKLLWLASASFKVQ
jgi:hypothetical protein